MCVSKGKRSAKEYICLMCTCRRGLLRGVCDCLRGRYLAGLLLSKEKSSVWCAPVEKGSSLPGV